MMKEETMKWLIWSNEHDMWWRPEAHGYTSFRDKAGRYELKRAMEICVNANAFLNVDSEPNETLLPDKEYDTRK